MRRSFAILVGLAACNPSGGNGTAGGASDSSINPTSGADDGDTADPENSESNSNSGSGNTASDTNGDATNGGAEGGVPNFDVSSPDGIAGCGAGGDGAGGGSADFSYIWIANSSESTISKINTQTVMEEGRYITRPDSAGNPSRTSVNLNGNVAVANRAGGVSMYWANPDDCIESNGMAGIQTSAGFQDVVAYDVEECRKWHTPLVYSSNRPAAWAPGTWDNDTCRYEDNKLWTAGASGAGTTQVLLLDGETGMVEQTVNVPEVQSSIGLYGGAVDGDGNFWGHETGGARLVRVDRTTFAYEVHTAPGGYGITVDSEGRPWLCTSSVHRFDPVALTWQSANVGSSIGGCMTDGQGTLWLSHNPLLGVDTETLAVVQSWPIPQDIHGVSIDFDGYVWGVPIVGSEAYRVDPATGTTDTFMGLISAYTYSDMTGFGLSQAGVPSG